MKKPMIQQIAELNREHDELDAALLDGLKETVAEIRSAKDKGRRERIATAVLAGMWAAPNYDAWNDKAEAARDAVEQADALIAALEAK